MNHPRLPRPAPLRSFLVSLLLISPAFAITPAEMASLRAKAEKGNAIAQYNLGLAYADTSAPAYNPVQAYVWLNLAADNGATGKALGTLVATMTPAQLAEAKIRLDQDRPVVNALSNSPISAAPPIVAASDTKPDTAKIEADKKQLSDELSSSWKETDRIKSLLADANKRLAIAETALANKDKEIATLQERLATPASPVIDTTELDALRHERDQLRAAFTKTDADRIALQSRLADANKDLAAAQNAQRLAEAETASLKSAADKTGAERLALAAQLESATGEATRLRAELAAATASAPAASADVAALREKLAASEKALADAKTELTGLKAAGGGLSPTGLSVLKADRDHLADSVTALTKERDSLAQQLAATKTAAPATTPAPAIDDTAEVTTARLANLEKAKTEAEAKLDAALRTYTLNQAEIDRLQKALANIDGERADLSDKLDAARKELTALRPQAEAAASSADQVVALGNQLTDTKRTLAERTAALDQAVKDLAATRQVADTVSNDLAATREQLRLTQAQAAASANEALNLKTRLALANTAAVNPSRPGAAVAYASGPADRPLYTPATATPPPPAPAATPTTASQPRTYVVSSGDSLYSIAKRFYGSASRWTEILAANRDIITNPNALTLGTTLRIP